MAESDRIEELLGCLLKVAARAAMPEDKVRDVVGTGAKQIKAFNLCDGTRSQTEIAKKCRIDSGNMSRTFARWVENGVAFWLGSGKDARPLHVYPLSGRTTKGNPRPKLTKRS